MSKMLGGLKDTVSGMAGGLTGETALQGTAMSVAEQRLAREQQLALTERARQELTDIFPAAIQNQRQGFQGALDIFGQSLPQQSQALTQGSMNAQQTLAASLPQFQNAILGGQVDFSAFQPRAVSADFGFAQQQLPEMVQPSILATNPLTGAPALGNPNFIGPVNDGTGASPALPANKKDDDKLSTGAALGVALASPSLAWMLSR